MRILLIILLSVLYALGTPELLSGPAGLAGALSYHFFHANIFHLLANCLSVWVIFSSQRKDNGITLLLAYPLATAAYFLSGTPVVGFSGILFASIGLHTPAFSCPWWRSRNAVTFFFVMLAMIPFPQFAALTHIGAFTGGVVVASVRRAVTKLCSDARRATGQ